MSSWSPIKDQIMTKWAEKIEIDNVLSEYPRPQLVRKEWKSLNGVWECVITPKKISKYSQIKKSFSNYNPSEILVPFPIESALSGVAKQVKPSQRLWYKYYFIVPESWKDKRIRLNFGAVDYKCSIWINGTLIGDHKGGYTPFSLDITDALIKNTNNYQGEQEIMVSVWDPTNRGGQNRGKQVLNPWGVFYTPVTGIWQTVWIEPLQNTYVDKIKFKTNIDKNTLVLLVNVLPLENTTKQKISCKLSIFEGKNRIIEEIITPNKISTVKIKNQRLWSPEDPFLYDITIELLDLKSSDIIDSIKSYFGMRKVSMMKDEHGTPRIALNNKIIFQYGPLDQGYWPDGIYTAPSDEALKYDIEITKSMGFNMTRKHIKIEPARWYYYCDKIGLPVWQDIPSAGLQCEVALIMALGRKFAVNFQRRTKKQKKEFFKEVDEIVDALYNHPSIIMWIPYNEGWGQFGKKTSRYTTKFLKGIDNTRLVNTASGWVDYKTGDVKDIHKYPGPSIPKLDSEKDKCKDRILVNGEFGGVALEIENHCWNLNRKWGYRKTKSQQEYVEKYESLLEKIPDLKKKGLSAAVYTQLTDVEGEINGLLTYDRKVTKIDIHTIQKINNNLY